MGIMDWLVLIGAGALVCGVFWLIKRDERLRRRIPPPDDATLYAIEQYRRADRHKVEGMRQMRARDAHQWEHTNLPAARWIWLGRRMGVR